MPPLRLPVIGQRGPVQGPTDETLARESVSGGSSGEFSAMGMRRVPAPLDQIHSHLKAVVLFAAG